jgi:asparagine synthase (glutamine-hydrolysing)
MCGILGGFVPNNLAPEVIEACLDRIRHRGPDESGMFLHENTFLGMRRLSIIDVAGGHQPIFNEDKRISVVFNGEVYNYMELIPNLEAKGHVFQTRSDTEVLVHLYEEHGTNMCQFLRGMFAFAILDTRDQSIFVARDRFGKKPFYYINQNGKFLFGSEIKAVKALAQASAITLSISHQAIYDYLSFGVIPQPTTIYNEVKSLPPASWGKFQHSNFQIKEYWSLTYSPKLELSYPQAISKVQELVSESVRLRLRSDVPLGIFLSGGVDSSVVAYEASKVVGDSLQTFTVKIGDSDFDESPIAAQTSQMLGVKNTVLQLEMNPIEGVQKVVQHYDQPYADSSAIPSLEISKLARQHVTVVLNGDGGDEIFGGYRRYVAAQRSIFFEWIPNGVAKVTANVLESVASERRSSFGFAARFARGLAQSPAERYLSWTADMLLDLDKRSFWRGNTVEPTERFIDQELPKLQGFSGIDSQIALDMRINLLSDLLVKMDMATMAYSLEARSPLLDHLLAETVARLPDQSKVGRTTKQILKDAYANKLPPIVTSGIKRGFEVPLESWLSGPLHALLYDTLGSINTKVSEFIEPSFLRGILSKEILKDRNWKYIVYALLILELWLKEFA